MTDLNALKIFAEVVQANSFSEAARRLKMPTSTVSRRIADLEEKLGVRLLERSTRSLRLTDIGSEVLEHAQHSTELSEAVDNIASNHLSNVSGVLRLSAPPSISDSFLAPLVGAFQASYPNVRVQVFITDRIVDQIAEGVDLIFKIGERLKDSSLVARRILTYRHQLVASPIYLKKCKAPKTPQDLLDHRLLAFSFWTPENNWNFAQANGKKKETLTFQPFLSMNDYAGLATALLAGTGIGDLPPLVQPELLRDGRLVEDAELALLHLPSLGGPSGKSLDHTTRACVQGIRGADGADTLSNTSDLKLMRSFRTFWPVDRKSYVPSTESLLSHSFSSCQSGYKSSLACRLVSD